jgi:3-keto-5-aminohexanoate cleavage enzyme
MVAPNGARRTKADHPALPITDDELITTARLCQQAGADGIHMHLRDNQGRHLLDAARYRALLGRMEDEFPDMYLQITSEAAGRYVAKEQRGMLKTLSPAYASVALREMVRQPDDWPEARDFYHWAADNEVEIQHILYSPEEVRAFVIACDSGLIPGRSQLIIFVQGSYAQGSENSIELEVYLKPLEQAKGMEFDWMSCAFGTAETDSLVHAAKLGGKARVGFENSLWNKDGTLAADNAERVHEVAAALREFELRARDEDVA